MVRKHVEKPKPKSSSPGAEVTRLKGKLQKEAAERKALRKEIALLYGRTERLEEMLRTFVGQEQWDAAFYKDLYRKAINALLRNERIVFKANEIREIEAAPVTFEELFKRLDRLEASAR